jgi:hypothetical protein
MWQCRYDPRRDSRRYEPQVFEVDSRVFEMWVTDKAVRRSVTEVALRRTNAVCYDVL